MRLHTSASRNLPNAPSSLPDENFHGFRFHDSAPSYLFRHTITQQQRGTLVAQTGISGSMPTVLLNWWALNFTDDTDDPATKGTSHGDCVRWTVLDNHLQLTFFGQARTFMTIPVLREDVPNQPASRQGALVLPNPERAEHPRNWWCGDCSLGADRNWFAK